MSGLGLLPGGNAMAEALAAPEDFFDMEILIHAGDADVQSRMTYWVQPAVLIQCLGIGRPACHSSAQNPGFCGKPCLGLQIFWPHEIHELAAALSDIAPASDIEVQDRQRAGRELLLQRVMPRPFLAPHRLAR